MRPLDGMSWRQFERLVGEAFRQQGYAVAAADGGIDLVLTKGSAKFLVQCKQWKAFRVGVAVVRELYGVMAAKGAAGGFVMTSGNFTDDATAFANGRNIKLFDGPRLRAMIGQAQRAMPRSDMPREEPPLPPGSTAPACQACSRSMVRRTSRRGTNAGSEFWGCSAFPACRGTRPIG